jgi:hypothetical protein
MLLNVPKYSFNWQMTYNPKKPLHIPGGSRIEVTGYFDNSAKNKLNPDPTKAVRHGEPTLRNDDGLYGVRHRKTETTGRDRSAGL